MGERATERKDRHGESEERGETPSEGRVERQDSPRKQHGDALRDGSGNRHGVHERSEEPGTRE